MSYQFIHRLYSLSETNPTVSGLCHGCIFKGKKKKCCKKYKTGKRCKDCPKKKKNK